MQSEILIRGSKIKSHSHTEQRAVILAIDDDPSMLKLISFLLRKSGFDVLQADSGEAALDLVREERRSVDLVVSDLIMPGMSAADFIGSMREMQPDCKLLLCSGYVDECEELAQQVAHARSLAKPFSAESLNRAVKDALVA